MSTRKRPTIIVAAILVMVGSAAIFFVIRSHSFQVAYHKRSMQRAYDAHFAEPDVHQDGLVGYTEGDEYERYEYHRGKLIQLGAVVELKYQLKHIMQPTDEGNHFTKFIMSSNRPASIDFSSPYPNEPQPMQLTVWCYPSEKAEWDELIVSRDIPNYKSTFMR